MSYQDNPFVPQMLSPTAYEIGRFGKTPASHFYGLPNIAIPLTEVRAKGFSLPISLSYNAGGNKPDQHPGWVGLGWSLNAGGSIIRVINGMKDEMSVAEYSELHGMQLTDAPGYLYHADKVQTETDWMDDTALSQNSVPWIDNEPDEYILNIDGINASFFITGENTIAVVSKEEASIELESYEIGTDTSATALDLYPGKCPKPFRARRYSYIRSFVIRDKYGNRYFFGGDDNSIEYSVVQYPTLVARENGYTNTNAWKAIATANAWMLTRIERTDGEVVTFEYEKNGVPIVFSDIHNGGMFVSPEYPQLNFNYDTYQNMLHGWKDNLHFHFLLPSYLNSIKCLQSGDELEFTTEDTHELPYPITESDFCTYVGDFSGEYALTGPFSYSEFQAENRYRKLVSISGVKRNIVFEYADNLQTRLKLTGINLHDGIENGGRYLFSYNTLELPAYNSRMTDIWGYYNGIDYSGILGNFCDGMTEVRIPSENLMKAEILVAVTYPTGGRTEYSYEPHTYKKTALPFTFTPEECESETMAGGLRIKSITDYATDNIPQTRAFEYAENGVPSGILCTQIQCKASGNMTFAEEHVAYTGSYAIYSEMPLLPLSDTDGRHVTYSFVRERFPDGGYIDYRFTNFDTEGCQDGAPANEVGRGTACPLYPQFTSRSLFRGLVKEQTTYRSDGKVLIRELFTYGDEGASTNFKSVSRHSFAGGHVLFAAYVSAHCGYPALLTKSETRYLDNNSAVIEGYDYSYNSRRLATRACHSRQSDRIEEIFYYPDDRSGSPYEKMAEAGMHGVQVGKAYLRNNVVIKGSPNEIVDTKFISQYPESNEQNKVGILKINTDGTIEIRDYFL